jgi:type IV pilus assembly protein PilE
MDRRNPGISTRRMAGVTLLELMAVVTVIGILGMIALPTYRQYVMRVQRTEAKAALLKLATNQERYYLANRTYGTLAQLVGANLLPVDERSERGTYRITIAGADATTYTATATPVAGGTIDMTGDAQCTTFSITAQGVRTATGTDAANCW